MNNKFLIYCGLGALLFLSISYFFVKSNENEIKAREALEKMKQDSIKQAELKNELIKVKQELIKKEEDSKLQKEKELQEEAQRNYEAEVLEIQKKREELQAAINEINVRIESAYRNMNDVKKFKLLRSPSEKNIQVNYWRNEIERLESKKRELENYIENHFEDI